MIIGEYSPIIIEPEANNCFSINAQVIIPKAKRKSIVKHEKILFHQKCANNCERSELPSKDSSNEFVLLDYNKAACIF